MHKSSSPVIVPPTRLLITGRQESRRHCYAHRPNGSGDWILIYNEGGRSYFRSAGCEFMAGTGDIILIRPGTPHDYGIDESHGYWKNTWTHFLPRPDCLDWLQWPELAPGMMHLHLAGDIRDEVRAELYNMDAAAHGSQRRHEEFAVNALERALLLCDSRNPRHAEGHRDERIRKAMRLLCEHPEERFTVESLARRCGLSRSRFAELFHEQAGAAPLTFLETQRMRRARELVEHTSFNLAEISGQCGFASPFYFSLRFKKKFGLSPRDYRSKKNAR